MRTAGDIPYLKVGGTAEIADNRGIKSLPIHGVDAMAVDDHTATDAPDDETTRLMEAFGANRHNDAEDIPAPIFDLMAFIDAETGLLGDYTAGGVNFKLSGEQIEVYGPHAMDYRKNLLDWVQEHERLHIKSLGVKKIIQQEMTVPAMTVETRR